MRKCKSIRSICSLLTLPARLRGREAPQRKQLSAWPLGSPCEDSSKAKTSEVDRERELGHSPPCPQPWLLQMARAQLRARRGAPGWRGRRAPGIWTSLARPAATLAPTPLEELGHMPEPLRQRARTPGTRRGGLGFPESRGQQSWHDQRSFLAASKLREGEETSSVGASCTCTQLTWTILPLLRRN